MSNFGLVLPGPSGRLVGPAPGPRRSEPESSQHTIIPAHSQHVEHLVKNTFPNISVTESIQSKVGSGKKKKKKNLAPTAEPTSPNFDAPPDPQQSEQRDDSLSHGSRRISKASTDNNSISFLNQGGRERNERGGGKGLLKRV